MRNVERDFSGKPERKNSLGRQKRKPEYNIDMDIKEMERGGGCRLIYLTQDKD